MGKVILKKVIDVTEVELTPGDPTACLGYGEQGFECCCDECDFFCFVSPNLIKKRKCLPIDVSSKGQFYLPPEKTETAD